MLEKPSNLTWNSERHLHISPQNFTPVVPFSLFIQLLCKKVFFFSKLHSKVPNQKISPQIYDIKSSAWIHLQILTLWKRDFVWFCINFSPQYRDTVFEQFPYHKITIPLTANESKKHLQINRKKRCIFQMKIYLICIIIERTISITCILFIFKSFLFYFIYFSFELCWKKS